MSRIEQLKKQKDELDADHKSQFDELKMSTDMEIKQLERKYMEKYYY